MLIRFNKVTGDNLLCQINADLLQNGGLNCIQTKLRRIFKWGYKKTK